MVRNEMTEDGRIRHYSDCGYKIRQIETNHVYEDAVDDVPCRFTYEETEEFIPDNEISATEALRIITGDVEYDEN